MARAKKETALTPEERLQAALVPDWEWPYKLPENWRWTYFKSISTIQTGRKDANYGSDEGKYPFFTCAAEPIRCHGYSFDCRAILLAGNGDINNISRYNGKFEAYQRTYVVKIAEPLCFDYIFYWFKYRWFDFNKGKMFGTAIPYIRLGNLQEFPTPIPPLAEQQRIVDRIESLFAKLDEAKEKAQAVVDSFETRKAAILHKAFTGELTAKWRRTHGLSLDTWKEVAADSLFEYVTSGSRGWAKYYDESGAVFIRMGNLDHGTIELDFSDIQHVKLPNKAEGQRSRIRKNDILISITADVGMVGLVRNDDFEGYINQHIALARPVMSESAEFIAWYLVSDIGLKQMQEKQRGATKVGLSLNDIRALQLKIPLIEEQDEILKVIKMWIGKEQQSQEAAEAVLDQIDLMKKSILARAFRGELGTNDPSEESAVELLRNSIN